MRSGARGLLQVPNSHVQRQRQHQRHATSPFLPLRELMETKLNFYLGRTCRSTAAVELTLSAPKPVTAVGESL